MEDETLEGVELHEENSPKANKLAKNPNEPGIIYLSRIPPLMGVKKIRHLMSQFGEIGRIFLQPDDRPLKFKKKSRGFTEGWVEFQNKKIAKTVARTLNNTQIGGKKRSRWHDEIWNMKYLPKFKWAHLNERLAYERAVHQQRMRTEIAQVKKETNFFIENVEKSERLKRAKKHKKDINADDKTENKDNTDDKSTDNSESNNNKDREWTFQQRATDDEILKKRKQKLDSVQDKAKKPKKQMSKGISKSFLQSIFSGGIAEEVE